MSRRPRRNHTATFKAKVALAAINFQSWLRSLTYMPTRLDITYVPMAHGFVYLAAVVDWFSRRVLAWRLSITMEASFCIEALEEALSRNENPEIFNTDQGSQFTSDDFTGLLRKNGIDISMDGRGRWRSTPTKRSRQPGFPSANTWSFITPSDRTPA